VKISHGGHEAHRLFPGAHGFQLGAQLRNGVYDLHDTHIKKRETFFDGAGNAAAGVKPAGYNFSTRLGSI